MNIEGMTTKATTALTPGDRIYVEGQLTEVLETIPGQVKKVGFRQFPAHIVVTGLGSDTFLDIAKHTVMPATYVEVNKETHP